MTNVVPFQPRTLKTIFAIRENAKSTVTVVKLQVPVTATVEHMRNPDDKLLIDGNTKQIIWAAADRPYMLGEIFYNIDFLYSNVQDIEKFPVRG